MGFWSPAVLVGDAKRHGVRVQGVDVNQSAARCTVEGRTLRLGLAYVKGLGEAGAARLAAAREARPFADLPDLCRRTRLPRSHIETLIRAGACDLFGTRRSLLWQLEGLRYDPLDLAYPAEPVSLPPLSQLETLAWEHETMGLSAGPHLLTLYRPWLQRQGIQSSADLATVPAGRTVRVAGLVVMHQAPPTARGVRFLTLEDEHGLLNVVVQQPIYERFRPLLRQQPLLIVTGTVQRRDGVSNVIAREVARLPMA